MIKKKLQKFPPLKTLNDILKKIDNLKNNIEFDLKDIRVKLDLLETKISIETRSLEKDMEDFDKKNEGRYNKVMTHLVDIAGKFKKFDEERVVLAGRQRNHEDRLEKLESTVFKTS